MPLWSRQSSSVSLPLPEASLLLTELESLQEKFRREWKRLPQRFVFAPPVQGFRATPFYSQRKLRTGLMEAGIGSCWINRNWDGLDRIEDLSERDFFDDVHGEIHIHSFPLKNWFGRDLAQWIHWLREAGDELQIELVADLEEERSVWNDHLVAAEAFRQLLGIKGYAFKDLKLAEHLLSQQFQHATRVSSDLPSQAAAYVLETFRARWGGHFTKTKQGYALALPFGTTVEMLPRLQKAAEKKRAVKLLLQADVLQAHERQGTLLQQLTWLAEDDEPLRRKAAIRILSEIADARVEQFFAYRLAQETESDLLMRMLDRLYTSVLRVDESVLVELVRQPHDGVTARAMLLLSKRGSEVLPELIREELKGASRLPLRPLARQLLEKKKTPRTKKILRELGPIPLMAPGESLLPQFPYPTGALELTAEILEDTRNPTRQKQAIELFVLFPNQEERETYGEALADPDPAVRRAAIGVLVGSDRPMARELLRGRAMFEMNSNIKKLILEALQVHS